MDKNNTITIRAVGNGFMVYPELEEGLCQMNRNTLVFQRISTPGGSPTLIDFIKEHFEMPQDEAWAAADPEKMKPGGVITDPGKSPEIDKEAFVKIFDKEPSPKPKA